MRKKQKKIVIATCVLAVTTIALGAATVATRMQLNDQIAINEANIAEMESNKQTVYTAISDDGTGIRHGDIIEDGINVQQQTVYTGLDASNYITAEDLGTTAIVDIPEGTPVMANMVTPVSIATDTREYEMQVVNLMVDQEENDWVDIRIMFPDGSDYLVLPKKQIKNLSLENCVFWSYLNEEEMLRMASATIDAFTITGTKIYATRYVESNLQDEAVPTYLVNPSVQDMMDPSSIYYDKNLLTKATTTLNTIARRNLEERLGNLSEEKLSAVNEGHGLEDTAKTSVLTGDGYTEDNSEGYVDEEEYVTYEDPEMTNETGTEVTTDSAETATEVTEE